MTPRTLRAVCSTAALGGPLFGFDTAVISGAIQKPLELVRIAWHEDYNGGEQIIINPVEAAIKAVEKQD